ncbi:hypothetical protein [Haloparvum sp. PAK95]|uniref:hypothetical protein n=1 Tax=Haloparvum sp. PAK95 TaxID=3418962 RepID=UPI003D2EC68E
MTDPNAEEPDGFSEGIEESKGDPRVLLALNALLSLLFGYTVVFGLSFADLWTFSAVNVLTTAIMLFALTYVVVLR